MSYSYLLFLLQVSPNSLTYSQDKFSFKNYNSLIFYHMQSGLSFTDSFISSLGSTTNFVEMDSVGEEFDLAGENSVVYGEKRAPEV